MLNKYCEQCGSPTRDGLQDLSIEISDLSRTISTDSDGAWWGDWPEDHLGNIAGYIGRIESLLDKALTRQHELERVLQELGDWISAGLNAPDGKLPDAECLRRTEELAAKASAILSKAKGEQSNVIGLNSDYCSCGAIHDGLEESQRCKTCGKII